MLTLTLLRHAKSDWADDSLEDFDRPLAQRGKKAAPKIGKALHQLGPKIDLVLCSPAKRTCETLDLVLKELSNCTPTNVRFEHDLYHAPPQHILKHVIKQAGDAQHVLVIGHNPGLELLASSLAHEGRSDDIAAMTTKFPTAALAQFAFQSDTWADIVTHPGRLTHFLTPRRL